MTASEELRSYLEHVRNRLRLATVLRGIAVLAGAALLSTLLLTFIIDRLAAFSAASLWGARGILWLILAAGAGLGLALPLWRLTRRWSARCAERAFPQLEQRLLTFAERDRERTGDPFIELLAADTLRITRSASARQMVPDAALVALAGAGIACLGVLLWLIKFGPGYWGYGAAALWMGPPASPLYAIRVTPGDATVRRQGDELITAQPLGLEAERAQLYARYRSASRWDRISMQPQPRGSGFQFLLTGIPEDIDYYVEVGSLKSPHYHLRVADVPVVSAIRVHYHYPAWTRLPDALEPRGGDLRAVTGTQAELEVHTDRPMRDGFLVLDDGRQIALAGAAGAYRGLINIEHDGAYHVAVRNHGETLRISEDYFIEAGEVKPPEVAIVRPGRDYRASPIEEVTVVAAAADAFGLDDLALHYSVNGGPERSIKLLKQDGVHQARGAGVISLENFKVVPGDVVSFYASAKDARAESHTDMAFIQVEPFEREFSQSQAAGGGGGGFGNGEVQITEREKEIIQATWQQTGSTTPSPKQAAEQAKFLSDVQRTLRTQSLSLAGRIELRDLSTTNESIGSFQQEMNAAAEAMGPAADQLAGGQWKQAIPQEQKALQHLLRAEATFRQIEVAFGSRGGAGSGAVNSAGRDLASLFDLELDMQKNQYETRPDASSSSATGRPDPVDEALRKLDELARRQDELSAASDAHQAQTAEQRWQQEMLRRQADELRRQLEQLARNGTPGASGQQGGSDQQAGNDQQGGSDRRGDRTARERIGQALAQLRQAEDAMRRSVDQRDDAGARAAAQQLREAMRALGGVQQEQTQGELAALQREAGRLANEERRQAERMAELARRGAPRSFGPNGARPGGAIGIGPSDLPPVPGLRGGPGDVQTMIDDRQQLADDLARLQAQMRDAERETLARSHAAAEKLRDALSDLDQADTETQLQRSADMLRRGYGARGDSTESDIESSLQHLKDQLGQAGEALAKGQPPSNDALDALDQLRSRLAALDPSLRGSAGDQGAAAGQAATRGNGGIDGPVTAGGGGRADGVNGAWNTGNNGPYGAGRAAPPTATPAGDPERTFQQEMSELGRLRRAVGNDASGRREVDELIRSMQRLDPRRFPGNPAMVEELYGRVVTQVDRLELQLRNDAGEPQTADVRSDRAPAVPPGYQDAVAEYYRRLSKSP
ncbi:MAG TPA: hypothetical protein VMU40_20155 [Steroidobacteraceae bacterium]|nr:hypothetical protein [Steroidobacteraceae bacterium]